MFFSWVLKWLWHFKGNLFIHQEHIRIILTKMHVVWVILLDVSTKLASFSYWLVIQPYFRRLLNIVHYYLRNSLPFTTIICHFVSIAAIFHRYSPFFYHFSTISTFKKKNCSNIVPKFSIIYQSFPYFSIFLQSFPKFSIIFHDFPNFSQVFLNFP